MIQIETVEADGFSMDYFRFGSGKKTMVILPGLSVQSVMKLADAVAEAYRPLAGEFTVYLFDQRKEMPEKYSFREMARDTAEALRKLGLRQVCLLGVSMGGMTAQEIALRDPDLVGRLALGSSAALETPQLRETLARWTRLAKAGDAWGLYNAFGEDVLSSGLFEQAKALLPGMAESVTKEELKRFAILSEGLEGFDVRGELGKIRCPVLVLAARDDRTMGGDTAVPFEQAFGGRGDFSLYLYEGYGHAAYDYAPDYKERLLRFFTQPASSSC